MFDCDKYRLWIGLCIIALFACIWLFFFYALPRQKMLAIVTELEINVAQDWEKAAENAEQLEQIWQKNKLIIQTAGSPETVSSFTEQLSEAKALIKEQNNEVIGVVSSLKELIKTITTPFQLA